MHLAKLSLRPIDPACRIWVLLSPFTFGYDKAVVEPSAGRQVWLPLNERIQAMTWSDIISGFALLYFGRRSLNLIARLASGSAAVSSVFG